MKMLKWLVLFVFSLSFITGCSQNEVKTDKKTAVKQTEQKDEKKQEQQSSEEQKQEEKPKEEQKQEEKTADSRSIEQNQAQKQNAEQSQNQEQKAQSQEKSKVVNEPKETPKQENAQQTTENQQSAQVHSEGTPSSVKPAPEPKSEPKPEPKPEVKTVTISVRDDQSTVLGGTEVELQDGDTVFKVLARTMKQKGIQMEASGSGSSVYVRGINNLYEKDKGDLSGWMYRVNGANANISAGKYKVKQGDKIEWFYALDYRKENR
ncbi:DUF4430 domain-containing protein [Bacillus sp. FJAT-53711]|uniref:DUF4430 domain-containing protein n=1 Tax=Bacillus yunxiaonensis TaxID=3127665 RepID=A0ABU8FRE9_9BACI